MRLAYLILRRSHRSARRRDVCRAGSRGGEGLIVELLRNLLASDELFVTHHVVLRLHVVRLRLGQLRSGDVGLLLRGGHAGSGVVHIGRRSGYLARGVDGGDGNVDSEGLCGGFGILDVGARLIDRDLIIAGVDFGQHGAGGDVLIVIHVHVLDVAGNARAERHQVAVHFGVVRGFVARKIAPGKEDGDQQRENHHEDVHARARIRAHEILRARRRRLGSRTSLRYRRLCRGRGILLGRIGGRFHFGSLWHDYFPLK